MAVTGGGVSVRAAPGGTDISAGVVTKPLLLLPAYADPLPRYLTRAAVTVAFPADPAAALAPDWSPATLRLQLEQGGAAAFAPHTLVRLLRKKTPLFVRVLHADVAQDVLTVRPELFNYFL